MDNFPLASLQREVLEYKFPDKGGEFIDYQLYRYIEHLKDNKLNNLDPAREELIKTVIGETAILRKDEFGTDQVLCNLISKNGFSDYDINNILGNQATMLAIFHHVDLDGIAAGALVYQTFSSYASSNRNSKVCLCPYNYGGEKVIKQICYSTTNSSIYKYHNKIAIIVDLNLNRDELSPILDYYDHILLIDHHLQSIKTIKNIQVERSKMFNYLVDVRYSAVYLCYLLFKDVVKKIHGYTINDIVPSIISMIDTRTMNGGDDIWSPLITVNKKIIPALIGRQFKTKTDYHVKTYTGKEEILGRQIYVRLKSEPVECNAYKYGMCLNQYFLDMGGIEAYSIFWKKLFKDADVLKSVLDIGSKLSELNKARNSIIYESEVKYNAEYKNNTTKGILADTPSKLVIRGTFTTRIIFRLKKNPEILAFSIYTDDPVLKKINLGELVESITDGVGGGHSGAAGGIIRIQTINKWYNDTINSKSTVKLSPKQTLLKEVFSRTRFWVDPDINHVRFDPTIYKAFKLISTIIFAEYEKYEKKGK